jgi:hypothetical protein
MTTHELKTWKEYFIDVWENRKKFEVRYNDRDFQVGDKLFLNEWDTFRTEYTGRSIKCKITYLLDDYLFVKEDYVIFSIHITKRYDLRIPKTEAATEDG